MQAKALMLSCISKSSSGFWKYDQEIERSSAHMAMAFGGGMLVWDGTTGGGREGNGRIWRLSHMLIKGLVTKIYVGQAPLCHTGSLVSTKLFNHVC